MQQLMLLPPDEPVPSPCADVFRQREEAYQRRRDRFAAEADQRRCTVYGLTICPECRGAHTYSSARRCPTCDGGWFLWAHDGSPLANAEILAITSWQPVTTRPELAHTCHYCGVSYHPLGTVDLKVTRPGLPAKIHVCEFAWDEEQRWWVGSPCLGRAMRDGYLDAWWYEWAHEKKAVARRDQCTSVSTPSSV